MVSADRVRTPAGTAGVGFFSPFLPLCGRTAVGGAGSGAGPWDTAAGRAVRVRGEGRERRGGTGCALVPLAAPGGRTSRRRPSAGAARLHRPQHSQRRLFRPSPGPRRAGLRQRRRACVFVCARAWCPVPVRASLCRVLRAFGCGCGSSSQLRQDRAVGAASGPRARRPGIGGGGGGGGGGVAAGAFPAGRVRPAGPGVVVAVRGACAVRAPTRRRGGPADRAAGAAGRGDAPAAAGDWRHALPPWIWRRDDAAARLRSGP